MTDRPVKNDPLALVTGGNGFLGRHLTDALISRGYRVRVADIRHPDQCRPGSGPRDGHDGTRTTGRVEMVRADLRDSSAAARVCAGVSEVFHLAGNPSGTRSVQDPLWDFAVNAVATTNVCHAAHEASVARLVYVSSGMVYGVPQTFPIGEDHPVEPFIPYAASKLSAEMSVRAFGKTYGIDVRIARPFTLYGPGEDPATSGGEVSQFLRWHLNGLPVRLIGDPHRKTRDFVHVDDAVSALLHVMRDGSPGGIYNIGTGRETSLHDLVEVIGAATDLAVTTTVDDEITEDTYRHVADIGALRRLGYRPKITIDNGVRRLVRELGPSPALPTLPTVLSAVKRPEDLEMVS